MKLSSMLYLTRQGAANLIRNRMMSAAGIGVLAVCLMITGVASIFTLNVDSLVAYLGGQNETVVYLDSTTSDTRAGEIYDEIIVIDGVESATFISKDDVLESYRDYLDDYSDLWTAFEEDNPFKANYSVVISDLENLTQISVRLQNIEGVYKVSAPTEMSDVFVNVQSVVTVVGYLLVGVLMIVSLVVISNTIRLSVYSRRKEIMIMKYVGATNAFIRWPFFVEGVMVGLVASIVAIGAVLGCYAVLLGQAQNLTGFWQTLLGESVVPLKNIYPWMVPVFLLGGILVGGMGSVFSVHKHLDV
ncbi:MAG: permease-like cell division protein FtsX [Faecalibacterium sp.]